MARLRRVAMTWGPLPVRNLGGVFAEGDVADVVEGLDAPVAADPGGELCGCGLVSGQAGDGAAGPGGPFRGPGNSPIFGLVLVSPAGDAIRA